MLDQTIWKTREREILHLLAEGFTDSEIGTRLHLSHQTIRWYNKHIYEKLGVNNRAQAVRQAAVLGLISNLNAPLTPPTTSPVPAKSPLRYVSNGGVHIAYQVIGDGPVDLLFIHGFLSHLELAWENPEFTAFFERLGRVARVILFDKRGMGLSDRAQGAPTLEDTIADACRVLDAVGSHRAFIMGTSEGGAAAALLASTYPHRVLGLILYASTPKLVRETDEPEWAMTAEEFENMIARMQNSWGQPWAVESFAPSRAQDGRFRDWWARILRAAASPSSVKAVLNIQRDIDIRQLLPHIRVRTLVIHKTHDRCVSLAAGRYFATHMPQATWVELPGADHIYFIDSEAIVTAVTQFCQETAVANPIDSWIAIILCALTPQLSSAATQIELNAYQPRHTAQTNGGIIALFDSPTRAMQCALWLRDTIKPVSPQISLHVGECSLIAGKPTESVVETATLAAGLAAPGEIILTRTLRDILAGSEFNFTARDGRPAHPLFENLPLYTLASA
jgi:pimeloyl-ACP methyl ester carboxylesterase/DNA-binding CsgD family transcriptional regulator